MGLYPARPDTQAFPVEPAASKGREGLCDSQDRSVVCRHGVGPVPGQAQECIETNPCRAGDVESEAWDELYNSEDGDELYNPENTPLPGVRAVGEGERAISRSLGNDHRQAAVFRSSYGKRGHSTMGIRKRVRG